MPKYKIAYLVSRFPHLPETFILREMNELDKLGWDLHFYPLICQSQPVIHEETKKWIVKAKCTPYISMKIIKANIQSVVKAPLKYLKILTQILVENISNPGFLIRGIALFPKAVYVARQMRTENILHIHAHYATHPALVAWIIHQLTGINYSITIHAHDIFESKTMLATKLKDATFIIAISEFNRKYIGDALGSWVENKTHVVHCGIRPDSYTKRPSSKPSPDHFEIIHIGSLEPYKGQECLIQACEILKREKVPFHVSIIGSGIERKNLERLIIKNHLENDVELLGPKAQEEIAKILPHGHCYVQPSIITPKGTMEGIPVALMEAMACGLPVVASSISGIPELLEGGKNGYLVPPADPLALAKALRQVYNEYDQALLLAEKGREMVLREFDLYKNVLQLSNLFQTI